MLERGRIGQTWREAPDPHPLGDANTGRSGLCPPLRRKKWARRVPHFQLVMTDGEILGPIELGRPDWPDGSIMYRGGEPNLRVVRRVEADDDDPDSPGNRPNLTTGVESAFDPANPHG